MIRLVILISGRGSNMEALLEANLPAEIVGVISNRPDAVGLRIAAAAGVRTSVVDHKSFTTREGFDTALAAEIDALKADYVLLAGFMRVLGAHFIDRFRGRILNIHPSLLPAFPGLHTHRQAIEAGVKIHGATVHMVTPALDHGPIIIQAAVPVLEGDDEGTLAARVLVQEHRIYPQAVRWLAEGRLHIAGDVVHLEPASVEPDTGGRFLRHPGA